MSLEAKMWIVLLIVVIVFVVAGNEACQWERIRRIENIQRNQYHWVHDIYHDDFAKSAPEE